MNHPRQNILAARTRLGECPVWDAATQRFFWVDVYNHQVHPFEPATKRDRDFDVGEVVSVVVLAGLDRLLVALRHRLAWLNTATGAIEPLVPVAFPHPIDTRSQRLG